MIHGESADSQATAHVVLGFQAQRRYIDACRTALEADKAALHKKHVLDPHWRDCAAGGELERYAFKRAVLPICDLDGLAASLAELQESNVVDIAMKAYAEIAAVLPGPETTIWALAADPHDRFTAVCLGGVQATIVGAGKIWLHLLPVLGWAQRVPAAIAHEHHHSVWLHRHFEAGKSLFLLNYLIFEGRACCFAERMYPAATQPWTEMMTASQEAAVWQAMKPELRSTSEDVMAAFIFGGAGGLRPLCGYAIGYRIVQAFLQRHPEMALEEWTALDADKLLADSGYDPCT